MSASIPGNHNVKKLFIILVILGVLAVPLLSNWTEPNPEFVFARLQVTNRDPFKYWPQYYPDNPPWHHDYPAADEFLVNLLHNLTGVKVTPLSYKIVRLDSNEVFTYPFVYLSEPGFLALTKKEIENLGEYIRRGGFIMVDDFRGAGFLPGGPEELEVLSHYLQLAMPGRELFKLNINHPIFHAFYDIDTLTMTPPYPLPNGKVPEFWGMNDEKGNLQLIANYNNDIGDFWKYLDVGEKPLQDSSRSIRIGMNYIIYAMSH